MARDVFLSYSSRDKPAAAEQSRTIQAVLQRLLDPAGRAADEHFHGRVLAFRSQRAPAEAG